MKACFILAALCGMLLAATAMTFDDDDIDELADALSQDRSSMMGKGSCRGCGWSSNDMLEEPLTADEIDDMMQMLDPRDGRDGRGGKGDRDRGGRGDRDRGGRGDRFNDGRGGYNTVDDDIFEEPATIDGEMAQDPQWGWGRRGWGWGGRGWGGGWSGRGWGGGWGGRGWGGGWGRRGWGGRYFDSDNRQEIQQEPATTIGGEMAQDPQWGWGGWGRPWGGWGGWGRGWGWGGRGWGGRYFDSDDKQEMHEEPETTADDFEDMVILDPQGKGGFMGGDRDRYRGGDRDRYRGDRDRYRGDRDRYRGDRDRYRGDRDRYRGDRDRY